MANILEAALQGLSFRSGLFEPFLQDVAASRRLTPLLLEDIDDTVLGNRLAALLRPHGERWLGLVPLYAVHDERALVAWTEPSLVPVRYLNLRQAADQMVADFMRGAGIYLLAGLSLILILLGIGLRSLVQLARVTLPVLGALVLTVAILHMSGAQLSLFHLVALLLVLGLGIDYGLFFARRATAEERARSGHAVTVCAISTAGVFGILALSQIPVLHAIGSTVALGVVLSYGFARLVRTT
jgi:predicted exporter